MGPLRLTDLVGLDVRRDILLNLQQSFNDDRYVPHPLLEEMVEKANLERNQVKGSLIGVNQIKSSACS